MARFLLCLVSMTLLWLSAALSAPITFHDAVEEAIARGPAVAYASAEQRVALGIARSTGTWLENPTASFEQDVEGRRTLLSLEIPLAGQPIARNVARDALRDVAVRSGALGRARAALDAGRSYIEVERAERLAHLASETLRLAERNRDAARQMLEESEVSAVDAVTLEAIAARAVQDATIAQQEALRARLAFEVALGRPPRGETTPSGWPELSVPEGVQATALPEATLAADQARAARALRTVAKMNLLPSPTVTGGWEQQEDAAGPSLGVSLQIPLFAPGSGAVRSAVAEGDRLTAAAERVQLASVAAWTAALGELDAAHRAHEASQIDGLEEGLAAIAIALESGEYSLAEYTARRDALIDGLTTAIETRYRLEVARLALWELCGELPPEMSP